MRAKRPTVMLVSQVITPKNNQESWMKLKSILKKLVNKETITYLVFGVLTTVVNFAVLEALRLVISDKLILLINVIAWAVSVAFAYVTNKLFVFESKSWKVSVLSKEIPSFVGARVFSLGVESLGLLIFITWLHFDRFKLELLGFTLDGITLTKIGLAVIVVIMNYVFSKFVIFKKSEKE